MRTLPLLAVVALFAAAPAFAARIARPASVVAIPKSGFRADCLRDLDDVEKKILELATAMPASKYSWRPAPGVRSVSEVYMHMAGGNYILASFVGPKPTIGDEATFEQITDKARVLDELRKSFDHLRGSILMASDRELDKQVRMFGSDTTERAAFMTALNHLHEHLGQSIAYARMNGVVPPWSAQ